MRHLLRTAALLVLCLLAVPMLAAISGVVMTIDGTPVPGARVSIHAFETAGARQDRLLSDSPDAVPLATTQTDAKGNFSLASPKDAVVDLRVLARGYDPVQLHVEREEETGAIALRAGEWKGGRVTAGGKAVAGATVSIQYLGGFEYVTRSGEDGRFDAPGINGARNIAVIHPDYAIDGESLQQRTSRSAADLQRKLTAGTALQGRVLSLDGKSPAAHATVTVDGWPLATSADDGTFAIAHAPAKWQTLGAQNDSLVAQRSFSKDATHTLRLTKAAAITGRIVDAKTKLPIPGVVLRTATPRVGTVADGDSALTNAKGAFNLTVQPGSYLLVAIHPGYEMGRNDASVASGQTASKDLSLMPRARVSGVVVDEERKPVAAAILAAEDASRPQGFGMRIIRPAEVETASGPDGRFSIRVAADQELRLRATRKGLPAATTETMKLAPSERKSGVVLTIPSGVLVTGRVTDAENEPLSGVAVSAAEVIPGRANPFGQRFIIAGDGRGEDDALRTDSEGAFSLRLKEGSYDFAFTREGYAPGSVRAQSIAANANNVVGAKLDPAVTIQGRVLRNGNGVPDVLVFAMTSRDDRTVTGPDGSFTIDGLPAGPVTVMIRKDDEFVQDMRNLKAPSTDVVIELPAGGRVTGRVVEKGTNKAITQFQAGLSRSRSAGGMVMMSPPQLKNFTSEDGSFTLENVPAGTQDLVANAPGYAGGRLSVTVEEGKTLSGIALELDTGTRLTGRVTGPSGTPLSDATVRIAPSPTNAFSRRGSESRATTDANGEYSLEALEPGEETIEFSHPNYVATRKNVTLQGRDMRLDAQLSGGQRVTGIVVTEAGSPVADADVFAMAAGGSRRSARTNASGSFELDSLAPARYRFSAAKAGFAEGVVEDVDTSSGAPVRITLRTGGTIYGRVIGLSSEEQNHATVEARSNRGYASAAVDASGNFKIEGAPLGTVQVAANVNSPSLAGRRSSAVQTVELEAGGMRQVDIEFRSDVTIGGRVTHNGVPMQGAMVSFSSRSGRRTSATTTTDERGAYAVSGLEDGEYNVTVMDVRLSPYTTTYVVRGSATFDVDYETSAVRGRVIDALTNAPINAANVQLRSTDPAAGISGVRAAMSDANGVFAFDSVAPGPYVANASKDGFGNETRDVMIGQSGLDNLELKLARNDGVTLKVIDARDGRVLDARATVYDAQGRVVHESRMYFGAGEGATETRLPLAPGSYTASVVALGYASRNISFHSPSTQTVPMTPGGTLVVRSKHPNRVRARLIDANGMPYPRFSTRPPSIELNPSPGITQLDNLAPGAYTLQLLGDNDVVIDSIRITIYEGQPVETQI